MGLLDRVLISMYFSLKPSITIDTAGVIQYYLTALEMDKYLPKNTDIIYKTLTDNSGLFPLCINRTEDYTERMQVTTGDVDNFNNSYFSVVTETKFFHDVDAGILDTQLDCILFSEKIYKATCAKHPFILAGMPGSLKAFRQAGFKTFHPYIDETYDTVENDEDRLETIMREVLRLSMFTDSQWIEWQTTIQSIVEHNFEHGKVYKKEQLVYHPVTE